MWKIELENKVSNISQKVGNKDQWYNNGDQYWKKTPATIDGM